MTLTLADFDDPHAHYAYQCATCAARYIVNMPPMEGNGGAVHPYNPRPMPKGADEAKAMALHCCHDNPEPTNGASVRWTATHLVGAVAHLALGDVPYVPVFPAEAVREYREHVVDFVTPGESVVWGDTTDVSRDVEVSNVFDIGRFRIDCMIDETHEGRRRSWALLLEGLRLHIWTGDREISGDSGWAFEPQHCTQCEKLVVTTGEDEPGDRLTFHAYARTFGVSPVVSIPAQGRFGVVLTYHPNLVEHVIPIGFLRVVVIGYEHVTP